MPWQVDRHVCEHQSPLWLHAQRTASAAVCLCGLCRLHRYDQMLTGGCGAAACCLGLFLLSILAQQHKWALYGCSCGCVCTSLSAHMRIHLIYYMEVVLPTRLEDHQHCRDTTVDGVLLGVSSVTVCTGTCGAAGHEVGGYLLTMVVETLNLRGVLHWRQSFNSVPQGDGNCSAKCQEIWCGYFGKCRKHRTYSVLLVQWVAGERRLTINQLYSYAVLAQVYV
jgi:hypothetical protein